MKYWTVQKRSVIDKLTESGQYFPHFELSDTIASNPEMSKLYQFMLDSFNRINSMDSKGLIFALCKLENGIISEISDVAEFSKIVREKKDVIGSMWDSITQGDTVLIEFEFPDIFNPLYIDINDFQFLMPPIMLLPPYTDKSGAYIVGKLQVGMTPTPCVPSGIAQVHLPAIRYENMVTYYEIDDINSGKFEKESGSAIRDCDICVDDDLPF